MKLPAPFRICLALAACAACASILTAQESPAPNPAEKILQEMLAAYSSAESYSDQSTAFYRGLDGTPGLAVNFRVWFARPDKFRVDAESRPPGRTAARREVMWSDGQKTRAWATSLAVKNLPRVQLVGSGLFGTYAYHVPSLLKEAYGARRRIHELAEAQLAGEEEFEGVACHRITGKFEGDPYELWIGKADHLVRKIVARYRDHELEEIHREIALNQPIPPDVFDFAPEEEVAITHPPTPTPTPEPTKK